MAQFDPSKAYEAVPQQQDPASVPASGFDPNKPYDAAGSTSDPKKDEGFFSGAWDKTRKAVGAADNAVTEALTPNPQNYGSVAKTNAIEAPKTLGREVYEGGKTILGMIPGAYHAVADEPTPEEAAVYGGDRAKIVLGRASGLTPAVEAGIIYADPKTRPTFDQAMSVLPEALGQGAGTVLGAKIGEVGAPKVVAAAKGLAPVLSGEESFIGRQRYSGDARGVVGNDFIPKTKVPVAEAQPRLMKVPYPDPETIVSAKEEPGLVGNEHTEGTPGELGKAKPSRATERTAYAEPTEFSPREQNLKGSNYAEVPAEELQQGKPSRAVERTGYSAPTEFTPKEESLVGNEHNEPGQPVQGTFPLSTGLERVPYADATPSAPSATEQGLVGNEYSEGTRPAEPGKPSRGLDRVPYADPTEYVKDITEKDVKSSPGTSMSEEPKKYTGAERREVERKAPLNATEMEDAIKNRKPFQNPFDVTEGANDTIKNDPNMPKSPSEEAAKPKNQAVKNVEKEDEWYAQAKKELGPDSPDLAKRAQEIKEEATKGEEKSSDRFTDKQKDEMKGYGLTDEQIEKLDNAKAAKSKQPEVSNNASGESSASQEAINRDQSNKDQGIKLMKVKVNGEEVPLFGPDAVDVKAGKGETIVKRYADGREEIQDQGAGAKYSGPKEVKSSDLHSGVKEQVSNLTNNDLKSLGEKYGLKSEDYDFKKREKSTREGSTNTYPVERIKFIEALMKKMPEDEKTEIGRQVEKGFEGETFKDVDRSQKGRSEIAKGFFAKLREEAKK